MNEENNFFFRMVPAGFRLVPRGFRPTVVIRSYSSRREYRGTPHEKEYLQRGLDYEFHCIKVLREFSFHARHKGSLGDKGIDFQGFWQVVQGDQFDHLSKEPHMYNIIGQCKHERTQCRSVYIKELEGVLSRWRHIQHHGSFITNQYPERMQLATKMIPIIGLIVNTSGYTQRAIDAFEKTHNPMIMAVIRPANWLPEEPTSEHLKSCLLYWRANEPAMKYLPGMSSKRVTTEDSTGTIVPSVRLFYNDLDVSSFELPLE